MKTSIAREIDDAILYPDDDGEPMSDDTIQFRWICTIVEGLQFLFRDRPDVFVAGNLLWYTHERLPEVRTAPDAMVVFGRPKGERGSYQQWLEEGVPPQVVFEIRSPGNRDAEMLRKFYFYEDNGVEEYYFFDPKAGLLRAWIRRDGRLEEVEDVVGWVSPLLGVRFEREGPEGLTLYHPDGSPFSTALEAREQALAERLRAERLAARLRELGESVD